MPGAGNNCTAGPTRANAPQAVAPGSAGTPDENSFSFVGPGSGFTYSRSDSAVFTSQLSFDLTGSSNVAAETEVQQNGDGSAVAEQTSTTGFNFTFTVSAANQGLILEFDAAPDLYAASADATSALASANVSLEATL